MQSILSAIRDALKQENWHAALFISMTLPDICCALEFGSSDGRKYAQWFDYNLPTYNNFLSGNDCYALRCSLLHAGKTDITEQKKREVLNHVLFVTRTPHLNVFKDCIINGVQESFLQLNVRPFCEDFCLATENWLKAHLENRAIQARLHNTVQVHGSGYIYRGAIKFE
jgi:hypothetical protein